MAPPSPPPATPSPHRFVIKKEASVRKSTLSQQPQLKQTPRPSSPQFNTTPRFTFSSIPRPTSAQSLPRATPSTSRYLIVAPELHDAIDESSDDILGDAQGSDESEEFRLEYDNKFSDGQDEQEIEERTPKRRRMSNASIPSREQDGNIESSTIEGRNYEPYSSLPILSSPPVVVTKRFSTTAPKFLPPNPLPSSIPFPSTAGTGTTFLKPPRFRPPEPAEQAQTRSDPLPEQFSPNRRGQRYVPGGLAAEVRNWLLNLENTIPGTSARAKVDETSARDEWPVRVVVDEVSGNSREGFTLIRGRQVHLLDGGLANGLGMVDTVGEVQVMLAGEGQVTGLQRASEVEAGMRIGAKRPLWEVTIEGERWGVGVDWGVLS